MIRIQSDCMYLAYLAQPLLVGQRGYVGAQPLESLVDALHAASLSKIGCLTLLSHLGSALQASRLVTSPATKRERDQSREINSIGAASRTYVFSVFSWSLLKPLLYASSSSSLSELCSSPKKYSELEFDAFVA